MNQKQPNNYLKSLTRKLELPDQFQKVQLTRIWANKFPKEACVYLIKENDEICYVGETGLLRSRMKDLLDTRNHVLRRKIGNIKYKDHPGFEKATSSKKFNPIIEGKLNRWIETHLKVSILVVALGRKELEEYIYNKYNKPKYNSKGKRV